MKIPAEQIAKVFFAEVFQHRNILVIFFIIIALGIVGVGLVWPKKYTSSTTILVDERNIIRPLMEGAAVPTGVTDRSKMAREVIYGRKIMDQILETGGWLKEDPNISAIDIEKLIEKIKKRTTVSNVGKDLIKIQYQDDDSERAYLVTKSFADLFIEASVENKNQESQTAFEFIDKQVKEYHAKLVDAENQLKEFRTKYVGAEPGAEAKVGDKINDLRARIEQASLALKEEKIKQESLEKQLSGEAEITASVTREGFYQSRIADLQSQLDNLLLNYRETYPDVIRIRHQIEDLKQSIIEENNNRQKAKALAKEQGQTFVEQGVSLNPLYQQLRSELSQSKTKIETLKTRIAETDHMLSLEIDRSKRINDGQAALAELTRDYEVNQNIYQDLLKRRENARVSMNLDKEQQGLTFKISEPAAISLTPSGLRFLHFLLGSFFFGILIPFGILYLKMQIDPRVRYPSILKEELNLPVVAIVPHMVTPREVRSAMVNVWLLGLLVTGTIVFIGYIGWLKWTGVGVGVI